MSYEDLLNLPRINNCTLIGNMTLEQLGIVPMSSSDISEIILEVFGYLI